MTGLANVAGAVVIALGALAVIAVLGWHGTLDKATTGTLIGSIVTGGFALAAVSIGASHTTRAILASKEKPTAPTAPTP